MLKKVFLLNTLALSVGAFTFDKVLDLSLEDLKNITVISASKTEEKAIDAPAKIVVITQDQIHKRGYQSLSELLASLSGFNVSNFSTTVYNKIGVRGLNGSNYFKILQDGIEIDQTAGEDIGIGMNFPLFGVKRVEILYGPASVIYGADALSGVINIITDDTEGAQAEIALGEDGYRYYNLRFAKKIGDTLYSLKGHIQEDQEYNFSKTHPDLYVNSNALNNGNNDYLPNASKSLNFRFKNDSLSGGVNYSHLRNSTAMATDPAKVKYDDSTNFYTDLMGVYLSYDFEVFDGWDLSSTLSYDSTEVKPNSSFRNSFTGYDKIYKYSFSERYALNEILTTHIDNHHIVVGLSLEKFNAIPSSPDLSSKYDTSKSPNAQNIYYPNSTIKIDFHETRYTNSALFIQDTIDVNDKLKLHLAGRYDINSDYENSFNPRLALIYQQNEIFNHKLIYSQAYLAPSPAAKFKHYGNRVPNDIVGDSNTYKIGFGRVPNPDLEPEKSQSIEYNLQALHNDLLVDFSLFYTKIDNLIANTNISNDTTSMEDSTVVFGKQSVNNGKANMYGMEISFEKRLELQKYKIDLFGNYSYLDGSIDLKDEGSKELALMSTHTVNLGATFSTKDFFLTPSLTWSDSYKTFDLDGSSDNRNELSGAGVFNLYGGYSFTKNITGTLKVTNLTNKNYLKPISYTSGSTPQPERLMIIGLQIRL